jgi:cytochrome c-type biogenesis protein CcmF
MGFVILLGTSAPLLTRLTGNPSQVQTSFYTKTTIPAAILLALLAGLVAFVSWKGETWKNLAANARRSLLVAGAGVIVGLLVGAREGTSLVVLFFALFAADMNLRAVVRKARSGKWSGAGGYLAHVGLGIMLAGIVVSGVYARSTRLTLPANQPVRVEDSKLTFVRVIPGTATSKQAMEVRVETPKGKTYYLYPKMYVNSRTNQLMANPAIKNSALFDFYIAPQSYDPGQPEQVGRDVRLTKGTTTAIDGTGFTFRDFNADRSSMMQGGKTILVLTDVTVTPADGTQHDATLRYIYHLDTEEAEAEDLDIPGVPGGKMRVVAVSPKDGAVVLRMRGVSKDRASEYQAATHESLSVDVTRKPLIAFVWGGFYVMMAGAFLAFLKRAREARQATLLAEAKAAVPAREAVAPTGPAVPVHSRSRL